MRLEAISEFEVKSWEGESVDDVEGGPAFTYARITKSFRGDLEGKGSLPYLMMVQNPHSAIFIDHDIPTTSTAK
jgi:hypothetical protein